jgi:molecular chaperone GrpE
LNDAQNPQSQAPAEAAPPSGAAPAPSAAEPPSSAPPATGAAPPAASEAPPAPEVAALTAELERTRQELARTTARLDEIARAYSAQLNEQRDYRARIEREKERVLAAERGKIAIALLEIGDELDRALGADSVQGPLGKGVRMIHDGLMRRLQAMGIERLSLAGKPFDPVVAEAVDLIPVTDPAQADVVMSEDVPGYKLGDKILRPARVRVARYVAPAAPPDGGSA